MTDMVWMNFLPFPKNKADRILSKWDWLETRRVSNLLRKLLLQIHNNCKVHLYLDVMQIAIKRFLAWVWKTYPITLCRSNFIWWKSLNFLVVMWLLLPKQDTNIFFCFLYTFLVNARFECSKVFASYAIYFNRAICSIYRKLFIFILYMNMPMES